MKALAVIVLVLGMLRFAYAVYVGVRDGIVRRSIVRESVGGLPLRGRRAVLYGALLAAGGTLLVALFAWPLWLLLRGHVALW